MSKADTVVRLCEEIISLKALLKAHGIRLPDKVKSGMDEMKSPPQVQDITKPTACLIRFNLDRPDVLYEVVVDPRQKSPSGLSIRFDHSKGCEAHGWKPLDSFHVVEVLKEFEAEEFDFMRGGTWQQACAEDFKRELILDPDWTSELGMEVGPEKRSVRVTVEEAAANDVNQLAQLIDARYKAAGE